MTASYLIAAGAVRSASPGEVDNERIAGRTSVGGGFFGATYFVNLIGPPSLALAAVSAAAPFAPTLRAHLAPFCHQIMSRSLCIDGRPFGLCARCTGIYVGVAGAWLAIEWLAKRPTSLWACELPTYAVAFMSVLFWLAGIEVDNAIRACFGFAFGASAGLMAWRARRAYLSFSIKNKTP